MQTTKYPGMPITLDGTEYVIPSLSLRQFQDNYAVLTSPVDLNLADAEAVKAAFDRYVPIIGLAIRRNHPEVTDESLLDWLGLDTFGEALKAVQGASGMKAAKPGEATPAAK